jgi:hypothetical protein
VPLSLQLFDIWVLSSEFSYFICRIVVQIIKDAKTYEDFTEVAKLFNLYGESLGEDGDASGDAKVES